MFTRTIHTSNSIRSVRLLLILFFAIGTLYYISRSYSRLPLPNSADSFTAGGKGPSRPLPQYPESHQDSSGPSIDDTPSTATGKFKQKGNQKAAFVTLVRNGELWEIVNSIRQIEDRFNRNYHYPWIFLNDVPFTEEFIETTSKLISGETKYGRSLCGCW